MTWSATHGARRLSVPGIAVLTLTLAACGGGGGSDGGGVQAAPPMAPPPTSITVDYPRSVVLGAAAPQDVVYTPVAGTAPASVTVTSASTLLRAGANPVVAEHVEGTLAGLRVVCASGNGQSTNVVTAINLGVLAKSAALLLDGNWTAVDATAAWSAATTRGGSWVGWENCGVKPEGSPSASSRLTPQADRGYSEDVYDGNPGTTFNVVTRRVASAVVAAMLSDAGYLTVDDPVRPLRLTLRAFRDGAGNTIFIETGDPAPGAPGATQGFVAPYFWSS